ncbi:MAG: 30S ribosomal protein S20 [Patescibacteria group bacterium]
MPIIKSAIKKVRKDKKRTLKNTKAVASYRDTFKKMKKKGGDLKSLISKFYSQIDRAVKGKTIHKNKAKRLKSQAAKLAKKK